MRLASIATACAIASATVVCAREARAQGVAAATATDEEDIRQGVALRREGRDVDAVPFFQRAYERGRSARAAAQLGLCEQALGRWVLAERHVREALANVSDPWVARTRATLESAVAVAEQHLGTIELLGGADGAEIFLDGERMGTLPTARSLRWVTGTIRVEQRLRGAPAVVRTVELAAGAIERVSLPAQSAVGQEHTQSSAQENHGSSTVSQRTIVVAPGPRADGVRVHPLVWGGGVGAVVGAVVASTAFGVGNGIAGAYDRECVATVPAPGSCVPRQGNEQSTLDAMTGLSATGWALVGVGAAVAGVGVVWMVTSRRETARASVLWMGDRVAVVGRF